MKLATNNPLIGLFSLYMPVPAVYRLPPFPQRNPLRGRSSKDLMETRLMMTTLVVYYSQSCANTARIAKMIADDIGADIAKIETVRPYVGSYDEIVAQG